MAIAFRYLDKTAGRDTKIAGRGLRVYTINCRYEMGDTPEYLADQYDVPVAAVLEALAYAAENPEEMDAIARADAEVEKSVIGQMAEPFRSRLKATIESDDREHQKLVDKAREARRGPALP